MTGWIQSSLGELCHITMGQSPPSDTYNTEKNGLPFFQGKAEFSDLYPVPQKWCSKPQKEADEGDILISVRAPVGDVNIADQYCCIGRGLAAIKYDKCPRFVFYFLKHSKGELEKLSTGTTFKAISKQTIFNYSLFIPSLNEQNEIVAKIEELFSELDNGVESLKKAREQLKTYRQAVLKYAFEGKLTQEWREQRIQAGNPPESAERLLARIKKERETQYQKQVEAWQEGCKQAKKDGSKKPAKPKKPKDLPPLTEKELAELPELPEGWRWDKFGEICDKIFDGTHFSPVNQNDGDYKYITAKNIKENRINLDNISYVTKDIHKEIYSRADVKKNDVLYIKDGVKTGIAAVNSLEEEFSLLSSVGVFRVNQNYICPKYLCHYLNSPITRDRMLSNIAGVAITRLTLVKLNNSYFAIAPTDEQKAIVSEIETRLSVCDQLEQTIEYSLKKAEALRQSILKKAFEGELTREWREAHPELVSGENSAESLLARIQAEKEKNSPQRRRGR